MPVERFRTHEDARRALWTDSADPKLAQRIAAVWARAARLSAPAPPPPRGLKKFRTIEEANLDRESWIAERVRILARIRNR